MVLEYQPSVQVVFCSHVYVYVHVCTHVTVVHYFLCRKNVVYNFTEAEVKVREATSNDPWGPPSTLMADLAEMTYSV